MNTLILKHHTRLINNELKKIFVLVKFVLVIWIHRGSSFTLLQQKKKPLEKPSGFTIGYAIYSPEFSLFSAVELFYNELHIVHCLRQSFALYKMFSTD